MKKLLQKGLSFVLLFALVLSAAACTGSSDKLESGLNSDITAKTTAVPIKTNIPDLKGATLTINMGTLREDLKPGTDEKTGQPNWDSRFSDFLAEVEKELNGKINLIKGDNKNLILSGQSPDLIQISPQEELAAWIEQELLQPWDNVKGFDLKDPLWEKGAIDIGKYKNKYYTLKVLGDVGAFVVHYNKDMIVNAGLEDPWELHKKNQWTWDKYMEIAQALTTDTNGDGNIDRYGSLNPTWPALSNCYGADSVKYNDKTGQYELNWDSQEYKDALELWYKVWNVAKCANNSGNGNIMMNGDSAMIVSSYYGGYFDDRNAGALKIWAVPLPRDPKQSKFYASFDLRRGRSSFAVPVGAKNTEAAYYFVKRLNTDKRNIDGVGRRMDTYTQYIKDSLSMQAYDEAYKNTKGDMESMFIPASSKKLTDEVKKGTPPATAIEMFREEAKAELKDRTSKAYYQQQAQQKPAGS